MYREKFESDPVTLRPPPSTAASPATPLPDRIRDKFADEARDCGRPMPPERRANNTQYQLQNIQRCYCQMTLLTESLRAVKGASVTIITVCHHHVSASIAG